MNEQLLASLEQVYGIESTSFIHYLISNAEVQVRDDFDREVKSFLIDWYRAGDLNRTAFLDLLSEAGRVPPTFGYPLQFSEYHYLNAAYLLRPAVRLMGENLESMAARASEFDAWPRARELVEAVVEREKPFLERARKLEAERPKAASAPSRIKGTSASRW